MSDAVPSLEDIGHFACGVIASRRNAGDPYSKETGQRGVDFYRPLGESMPAALESIRKELEELAERLPGKVKFARPFKAKFGCEIVEEGDICVRVTLMSDVVQGDSVCRVDCVYG
jgi:hypothetical protein